MSDDGGMQDGYSQDSLGERARAAISSHGLRPVTGELLRIAGWVASGFPWTTVGHHGHFELQGQRYPYLYHRYKRTWLTERAVEIPVVQAIVDAAAGQRVLELGNVLAHYRPQSHVVVDKYEPAPGVLNRDVLDLEELGRFDLIVSISTVEHVGWDEAPRDPDKAVEAVSALRRRLAPGGRLVFTAPVGYNPVFDAALRDGAFDLSSVVAMSRLRRATEWHEVAVAEVWSAAYDFLLFGARGVIFAFIEAATEAAG